MTDPTGRRAELEARNAAMREQVDSLLAELNKKTAELRETQAKAMAITASAVSKDGSVRATVDSAGALTSLEFSASAFERTTPDKLARLTTETVQQAVAKARTELNEVLAPAQQGASVDLSEMLPGVPSLSDLIPKPPVVPQSSTPPRRPAPRDDDEGGSFMDRSGW
ncbi:YbaB/EbfC family nucleoid-associated protein [Saccharothrix longispora]|uniref:YbaB/EbfC family nucleoid-associated protein n=1 Tax=Saccharothrix longispora TaxID=33920 RepID=UPI0028FD3EA1|nr:YbaB/EbfC family nucleoid-associated protein [Saccharothrix longispora]MDU0292442.1 YbaB/EbfC family nucleoid-associated protein [Saccharothrix longispora]